MTNLIAPTRVEISVECDYGGLQVEAYPTGRKDQRGNIDIRARSHDGRANLSFSPDQARNFAKVLVDLADKASKFSTRGFVGSDE